MFGFVRFFTVALLSMMMAAGAVSTAHAERSVTGARLGEHANSTRFVLDLDGTVEYRAFTLSDPHRVVLDMSELKWGAPTGQVPGRGLVGGFRYGMFEPGTFRVVLDLAAPARIAGVRILPPENGYGHRLVLDLTPIAAEAFGTTLTEIHQSSPAALARAAPGNPGQPARRGVPDAAPRDGKPIIVIDAGHGGVDPGAIGASGVYEKTITLDTAQQLRDILESTGRYRVVMTRDRDIFLRLRDRMQIARDAGGSLFISLHADSHPSSSVRGLSVYTLSETASDAEAAALAARENRADVLAGVDLGGQIPEVADILFDLMRRETSNLSAHFASVLVEELRKDTQVLRNTHRFAGFAVLKAPDVPSILLELGYLSNPEEERLLRQPAHRRTLADAIARAVDRYFDRLTKLTRS